MWPAVKNTVWNGDNALIHCIKGRHRGAFLAVLCRSLLADESIDMANKYIEVLSASFVVQISSVTYFLQTFCSATYYWECFLQA